MVDLQTGPKPSLDGVSQWAPTKFINKRGEEGKFASLIPIEEIEFLLKGVAAPTETLRKLKANQDEPPKVIKGMPES